MNRTDLISLIELAFDSAPQPEELTLHVANAIDYRDYDTEKHHKKDFIGHWRDVPTEHLAKCQSALSFLDAIGMRFYLPAYMVWELKNFGETPYGDQLLYSLDNSPYDTQLNNYHKKRFSLFNSEQMKACALFVKYCAEEDSDDVVDVEFAKNLYTGYWHKYS